MRWAPTTLALAFWTSSSWAVETIPCAEGVVLELSTREPSQGDIVLVEVRSGSPTELRATWSGRSLHFWKESDTGAPQLALIGVDFLAKPGPYALTIEARLESGERVGCSTALSVRSKEFPVQRLTVEERYIELSREDLARAGRDTQQLAGIFRAATAARLWEGGFQLPLQDAKASGSFGRRRILNDQPRSPHSGEDFSAPSGTLVLAPQRGRVVLASDLFFSGNSIVLDHGLGLYTFYGHLESMAVQTGDIVKTGTLLGRVGATGRVTGPHLHWAVRLNNTRVDPLALVSAFPTSKPPT